MSFYRNIVCKNVQCVVSLNKKVRALALLGPPYPSLKPNFFLLIDDYKENLPDFGVETNLKLRLLSYLSYF